jgi:nucleoid-associated protein YgaU
MKRLDLILILGALILSGCSNSSKKKTDGVSGESVSASSDADFIVDSDDDLLIADAPEQQAAKFSDSDSYVATEVTIDEAGETSEYTVKQGDTLMLVAFNLYGDYRKWRHLKALNGLTSDKVSQGTVLKYYRPVQEFSWNPEGTPHMIKMGESLGTISNDKYGTPSKWKKIFANNRPMIHDPNLIFAGFTLYYIPEQRDIASE